MHVRAASMMLLLLLGGCAYEDAHLAEAAKGSLIGMSVGELDLCAGLPTKSEHINPSTELRSYERNVPTNSGVNITFPVVGGGMNFGNGGYCHANFELVNGRVTALSYAGATSVAGLPYAICAPIVRTCVQDQTKQDQKKAGKQGQAVASRR